MVMGERQFGMAEPGMIAEGKLVPLRERGLVFKSHGGKRGERRSEVEETGREAAPGELGP